MKLHKVLTIGGTVYPLVKDDVRLDSKSPGRATFTIQAGATVKGLVTLDIGYNENPLQRHFIGYVERSTAANSLQQILVCRELTAILANPLPLNLRHVDLQAVLAEIGTKTGLRFRVPDQPYARVKAPYFLQPGRWLPGNGQPGLRVQHPRLYLAATGRRRAVRGQLGRQLLGARQRRCNRPSNCSWRATRVTRAP